MPSSNLSFSSRDQHRSWLATQAALPRGFRVGTTRFDFVPYEAPKPAKMTLTLIALDKPTDKFAAMFTRNAFPGAPIVVGRKRLQERQLGAILVNNKISNVCAPGGVETAEEICSEAARLLSLPPTAVLPSSTGVIGWRLPRDPILANLPQAVASLSGASILPAAEGIVTTDLYPKIRRSDFAGGSIVGIAKGAGMIEPNLATMLVYVLTDLDIPRETLREILSRAVARSFNSISIDSDTSTSDTVVAVSTGLIPCTDLAAFEAEFTRVCRDLAEDVVRNGEGVRHVIRVQVKGAPSHSLASALGKAIVNAPLFKCAVAGNDPNVGRLIQAIGKYLGATGIELDLSRLHARIGGIEIFAKGAFQLNPEKETALVRHFKEAELYASVIPADGVFSAAIDYPPHERCVEIEVDLGLGAESAEIFGGDLTHEYVSENADYRS
ncbi:MAG: bifunctional ornithine acetyltransferase/N-acetylglutamate synthase [Opitutaceae bacterium]|nr:bifunctional ornithine acetyltransferase/N-acetylglutamate synthase [Opitutaceae bacterium]